MDFGFYKRKNREDIDAPIPENILMYLINAIYFKGDWENKFDAKATADSDFHSGDGKTGSVRMMQRNGNVEYANLDGDKAIRLPYKGGITSMYCILPKEGTSIDSYIESMNSGKWTEIRKTSRRPRCNIEAPGSSSSMD
jgi:serpin B